MKPGTKVVMHTSGDTQGHKVGSRGTVLETFSVWASILVEWDDGTVSLVPDECLAPLHALKMALKHGPKIRKRM